MPSSIDPTILMVDQLLRTVTYVALTTTTQCLIVSLFVVLGWLVWCRISRK